MTMYTIHVKTKIDRGMNPKVLSFLAMSDESALSIASHFCTEKQIGVELFEYGGPAPGKVYARWMWSIADKCVKRIDLSHRIQKGDKTEFVLLCFDCMGFICIGKRDDGEPQPLDSWNDPVTIGNKTGALGAPCARCGSKTVNPDKSK